MVEPVKKAKAPAKPREPAANKSTPPNEAAPAQGIHLARPSHDQIAELARRYWTERGYKDGRQEEDWFRAEQELRGKAS